MEYTPFFEFLFYICLTKTTIMKKIILLSVFLHLTIMAFSQRLTISEMIEKTKCKTFNEFNNFAMGKKFTYSSVDDECCNGTLYMFNSDTFADSLDGCMYKTQCQFFIGTGARENEKNVAFITRTKKNYLPILKQLEKLKFKVTREVKDAMGNDRVTVYYSSPSYTGIEIQITLSSGKDLLDNPMTMYFINVVNISKT